MLVRQAPRYIMSCLFFGLGGWLLLSSCCSLIPSLVYLLSGACSEIAGISPS